jgi:hypothetical protein
VERAATDAIESPLRDVAMDEQKSPDLTASQEGREASLLRRIVAFAVGAIVSFLASIIAFVLAMGTALHWPLSEANVDYALTAGAVWGAVGGFLVGLLAAVAPPHWRTVARTIAIAGSLWAIIAGFCFFVHVAAVASC